MSPCTTRIGSTKMSLANLSIFFRKVALKRRAVKEIVLGIKKLLYILDIFSKYKNKYLLCLSGRTWLAIDLT